ncbi:MAG TPA: DNA polymerase, partial [Blastocatellia bacterium]|nr:DNA polymerase [Blastocatellia bacterium]
MKSNLQIIKTPDELREAAQRLSAEPFIGFDTETTGLSPHSSRIRLMQIATPQASYVIDLFQFPANQLGPVLKVLAAERPVKIAHNAKFDAQFILKNFGVRLGCIFDTYLASILVSAGQEGDRQNLEAVAQRYLDIQLDKSQQMSNWAGPLSDAQLEYAALDAQVVLPLREKLDARIQELELQRVAAIEFDLINTMAAMELAGIYLDANCWRAQAARVQVEYDRVAANLKRELSPPAPQMSLFETARNDINLDSPAQIKEALGKLGIKVESTREWMLHKLAAEHPVIERLLEYRGLSKSLSAYGLSMLEYINPTTGRIHANFRQIAAPTGRMGCTSPNLQQIPHSREYRECFRAPEGRKFVIADFSQIEMRILADFSEDEALIAAFGSNADLHKTTASQMLGVPLDQVTPQQRAQAKGLNYGLVYGMGAEGLSARINTTVAEAESLIKKYFAAYPGVARWLNNAAETTIKDGRARSAAGRLWIFGLDASDRTQLGQLRRLGKNAPIQGTASDIFKRAMKLVDEALTGIDAQIVHSIHDEVIV